MGRIGIMLSMAAEKFISLIVETYLANNQTVDFFSGSGDDSPPLKDDRILLVRVDGTGRFAACSVLNVSQGAKPGEKILFARDKNGNVVSILKMLNNGNISLDADEKIKFQGGGKAAARKGDKMTSGMIDDPVFWTWISAAGGVLSSLGVAVPIPTSLTGKITEGSGSIELGD